MKTYAIILARGGSKGVPKKNIKLLAGKPLIAWTIEAALASPLLDKVYVSTDDAEIAEVSRAYGAEVLHRPSELAEDMTLGYPVFRHHLDAMVASGDEPDIIVDLRPTSPLRGAHRITEAVEALTRHGRDGADSVRSVVSAAKHPHKMWKQVGEHIVPFLPESITGMKEPYDACRQELPIVFQNNGAVYAIWKDTILNKESLTGDKVAGLFMDDWESINIDTEIDFLLAEEIMHSRESKPKSEDLQK